MDTYFSLSQSCAAGFNRPAISYKVREYFEVFVLHNVLLEKKIIINGKWRIALGVIFVEGGKFGPEGISLAKTATTISEDQTKLYEVVIPMKPIQDSDNSYLKTIELMYEAIVIFFVSNYKNVTVDFMNEIWLKVDLDYLLSLPYPALLIDQKYIGDKIHADGSVKIFEY